MTIMPAFCDTCGTAFPSGFDVGAGAVLIGNKSGPCPRCGGMGSVPNGLVSFIGNAIRMLPVPTESIEEYKAFSKFLKESRKLKAPVNEVREKVEKDYQNFALVFRLIGDKPSDFYTFIGTLVAILALCIQIYEAKGKHEPPSPEKVLQSLSIETGNTVPDTVKPKSSSPPQKVGRNERCPCGSGKKYKQCHGEII